MKILKYFCILIIAASFIPEEIYSQERVTLRGTSTFRKVGVHRGNQVRTVFTNYGVIAQPGAEGPRGAWKFDPNGYVGDVSPLVGLRLPIKDYTNNGLTDTIHSVIITPVDRPGGGEFGLGGKFWGFEPITGFANPLLDEIGKGVAMSHQTETWPDFWPDRPDWLYTGEPVFKEGEDITPKVDWNGYFGRGQFNADQESYWWMDDYNDEEFQIRYGFIPDANIPSRTGHAIQVNARGLQWSNFLAQDVIFWLYNITNDGTSSYDQAVFGVLVGTYVGVEAPEYNDDVSFFDIRESITYTWDFDNYISPAANPQWMPNPYAVGYIAYAFLESPGNEYDGIDNDGDNDLGYDCFTAIAKYFTEADFAPRVVQAGDKLIRIDKETFQRTSFIMPNDTITVYSMGVPFFLEPGVTVLAEGNFNPVNSTVNPNSNDGIDNNLNGIIDENFLVHYRVLKRANDPQQTVLIDILAPVMFKNYITGEGVNDLMIDESRSDGIDNDCDWVPEFDDVGADGKPGTIDFGEGDGIPTPGEPNFDQTDVNESDQIGLTSFQYFVPAGDITMSDDEDMWRRMKPGFFQVPTSIVNNVAIRGEDGDFIYGSGYFPLLPGKTERFSLALAFGDDFPGVLKTKQIAQTIYNANYNFPRPPDKPTLTVVPGNGKVTLYWDRVSENSIDPTLRIKDFEGYKIYKGTDPDLSDALQITNGQGVKVFYKPIAQYDLINGIKGYFISSPTLWELTNGTPFYLGSDNGIQNFYVDNDVLNGRTYYYALVAYDRGDASKEIFPSENTRFISKDALGRISTDINTAAVIPNAPVIGYVPPETGEMLTRVEGKSTSTPYFEVIDPFKVKEETYTVTFVDSAIQGVNFAYLYKITDSQNNIVLQSTEFSPDNGDVFNGVRLSIDTSFQNLDSIKLNRQLSGWNNPDPKDLRFLVTQFAAPTFNPPLYGIKRPIDLTLVFSDTFEDTTDVLTAVFGPLAPPAKRVNFRVYNTTDPANPERLKFAFTEGSPYRPDTLSFFDQIFISNAEGTEITWRVLFTGDSTSKVPLGGDTLYLPITKPFSSADRFTFTTNKPGYDPNAAKEQLDRIKVVPNPYVVTNVFEQPLPPQVRGRGERIINFINLPPKCKIHIYTSSGSHVRSLEHDGLFLDGSVTWDLRTKEGLDVAYGVYFYVVEVDGISDKKMGKIAIIK